MIKFVFVVLTRSNTVSTWLKVLSWDEERLLYLSQTSTDKFNWILFSFFCAFVLTYRIGRFSHNVA